MCGSIAEYATPKNDCRSSGCCCSIAQLCPTLCDPMDWSTPGFPVLHHLLDLAQTPVHWVVMPSNCLILYRILLLLPSVLPSIRVFSNESALCIRWPKYWSFSLNISPSNEHSVPISFRRDWLDLLAVQGLSKVFSSTTVWKHQFFSAHICMPSTHIRICQVGRLMSNTG